VILGHYRPSKNQEQLTQQQKWHIPEDLNFHAPSHLLRVHWLGPNFYVSFLTPQSCALLNHKQQRGRMSIAPQWLYHKVKHGSNAFICISATLEDETITHFWKIWFLFGDTKMTEQTMRKVMFMVLYILVIYVQSKFQLDVLIMHSLFLSIS
jgi:hypothetical protein